MLYTYLPFAVGNLGHTKAVHALKILQPCPPFNNFYCYNLLPQPTACQKSGATLKAVMLYLLSAGGIWYNFTMG
jgi:hypothetical protein